MPAELHVSSLLVHARPSALAEVRSAMAALAGVEIHGASAEGKLVVVLETGSQSEVVDRLAEIQAIEHVLSTVLVFHRVEPQSANEGA